MGRIVAQTTTKDEKMAPGRLFVVSAPSGAGKTTLCAAARRRLPDLVYSVSSTTRPPREDEVEGRDYFFVSEDRFKQGIAEGLWAEYARVHGNYYGTSADFLESHVQAGRAVLLDIDVQGARQILQRYPEAVTIFITVPSLAVLRRRLTARGSETPEVIDLRMKNARAEMDCRKMYQHVVVNDHLDVAIEQFVALLSGGEG
jgi:guanylate kinase